MSKEVNHRRQGLLGIAAFTCASAQLILPATATAEAVVEVDNY